MSELMHDISGMDAAFEKAFSLMLEPGTVFCEHESLWRDTIESIREWFALLPDKRRNEANEVWENINIDADLLIVELHHLAFYYGWKTYYDKPALKDVIAQDLYYRILRSEFRKEDSKLRLYFMNIRREKDLLNKLLGNYSCNVLRNFNKHFHFLGKTISAFAYTQGWNCAGREKSSEIYTIHKN